MAAFLPNPAAKWADFSVKRRVLVVDPGAYSIKVLLAESFLGRTRILRKHALTPHQEGLLSGEEIQHPIQSLLAELGHPAVALTLPQQRSLSQVIDLPPADIEDEKRAIERETFKLGGLSESIIVYDAAPLKPFGKARHPYWLTLAQESQIFEPVARLGLGRETLCEITTSANAMIAAYRASGAPMDPRVLTQLGAEGTDLVVVLGGQGVYAASFPIGGGMFTEAIANQLNISSEAAEARKREEDLLNGEHAMPALAQLVLEWLKELEQMLQERLPEQGIAEPWDRFTVTLAGGGAPQPGLLEFLRSRSRLRFEFWAAMETAPLEYPGDEYLVAYGTALQALGLNPQSASLLPADLRNAWNKRRFMERFRSANLVLLLLLGIVLGYASWHKLRLGNRAETLLEQAELALEKSVAAEFSAGQLSRDYERLRPVLERQKFTLDTLETLTWLQAARSNRNFLYVLFADQESYFSQEPVGGTNAPAGGISTNQIAAARPPADESQPPVKHGYIAEVYVPDEGEAGRRVLTELVDMLKSNPLFRNVDSLPSDRVRILVDPKLADPDHHFSLEIELAANPFRHAHPMKMRPRFAPPPREPRNALRTFKQRAEQAHGSGPPDTP